MKKIILDCEAVKLAYKELSNLDRVAEKFKVSRGALTRFMDANSIERKVIKEFFLSKEQLEQDYKELNSTRKIADKYGVCRSVIKVLFRKHTIETNVKGKPERFLSEIINLTQQGKNSFEIAEALSISFDYVNEIARDNGIKLNRRYHKGFIVTHNGYKMVKAEGDNPDADSKGYVREHRLVAAKKLGKKHLSKDIVVHHKDGDKLNNEPDNLEIMTLSDHSRLHRSMQH